MLHDTTPTVSIHLNKPCCQHAKARAQTVHVVPATDLVVLLRTVPLHHTPMALALLTASEQVMQAYR